MAIRKINREARSMQRRRGKLKKKITEKLSRNRHEQNDRQRKKKNHGKTFLKKKIFRESIMIKGKIEE